MLNSKLCLLSCLILVGHNTKTTMSKIDRDQRRARLQELTESLQQYLHMNPVELNGAEFARTAAENKELGAQLHILAEKIQQKGFKINMAHIQRIIDEFNEKPGTACAIARNYAHQTQQLQKAHEQQATAIQQLEQEQEWLNAVVTDKMAYIARLEHKITEAHNDLSRLKNQIAYKEMERAPFKPIDIFAQAPITHWLQKPTFSVTYHDSNH